ncbi:PREDICTED: uncharacterized protein LOC101296122 isoform X1 [Fragaria vesca subsp. vesca]|uniref:uncharacterized protein LOC101296122 isoform X1 n=1 Tax=Fragaria vesca subsp. vesca TaxID=101020 RepID=UPI0002C306E3|nr:PREDICTED: uncharacterized protein LOC101296122 isoform X1 [Fragaria vesca subsp. vesca]
MARSKNPSKKQQKRGGIDFKKIKRKIGRKLPPAQNATNTEIKSKAIVLPEQSVASEKAGLAVNKKGLTLKELLQQTSHYNSKVRKDALLGIKDLFLKHPEELRLHKYTVIEKLRERIGDDDRLVRETLYQLFKLVIFPGFKEDNQELFVSLMMAYIFNSMTNLAIDVRLMAFKFLELVIQYYPPSFFLYAEKILQNFEDILRKNQFFLEDKSKLKTALSGLERCLLLLPCNKKEVGSCKQSDAVEGMLHGFEPHVPAESAGFSIIIPKLKDLVPVLVNCFQDFIPAVQTGSHLDVQSYDCMLSILHSIKHAVQFFVYMTDEGMSESRPSHGELDVAMLGGTISIMLMKKLLVLFPLNMRNQLSEKDDVKYFVLDSVMTEIFLHLGKWICPPGILLEKFLEFLENALLGKICSDRRSGKAIQEKHLISLLPFVPKLVSQVPNDWKSRLLQAFTNAFKDCNPVSSLKLACLSTMEEMVVPRQGLLYLDPRDPEILNFQIAWIRELPMLLILLGDKNTSHSQVVLHLLLRLGQRAFMNYSFALEYDNMQFSLQGFFCIYQDDGNIIYGPFVKLPRESQELSLCCLRYISNLDLHTLRSIAYCCLCPELEQFVVIRVIEILHSAYKSGHIQIADHISFFITLLSRFRVLPENVNVVKEKDVNISNQGTFKSITSIVCSCLSQMGDSSLVFKLLEKMVLDQLSQTLPLDNVCAMLRMLIALDSEETIISEQAFVSLVEILPRYLIDIVHCIADDDEKASGSSFFSAYFYYLVPCFFLFVKSHKLLGIVLKMLGSWINESLSILPCDHTHYETDISSRVEVIVSVLLLLHNDEKIGRIMSSFKAEIDYILQSIISIQSSEEISMTIQEKHQVKCAHDRLKNVTSAQSV